MNIKKLKSLIRKEENSKLDFKLTLELNLDSSKKELAKDICSIANAKGGRGYLVIGIEDKTKRVVGINKDNLKEERIQQIVSSRIDPPIPVSLDFFRLEEKDIAVITIYDGKQKPYQIRETGAFLIRRGSTTDTMRREEIASVVSEGFNLNVELTPVLRSNTSHLDKELIEKYLRVQGIKYKKDEYEKILENIGMITREKDRGEYVATLGGLLVFSKINNIYLPHNMIKINNRINKNYKEDIVVQGDISAILEKTELFLKEILPENYPMVAMMETVKNAVLYRDYTIFNKEIEIDLNHNNIMVISPGAIFDENLKSNNAYSRRNMWLYEKLITLDNNRYVRKDRGFNIIKESFRNKGRVRFINSLKENYFKVILPGVNKYRK